MKYFLILFLALFSTDPRETAKINQLKLEAEEAFLQGEHQTALSKYLFLQDSLGVDEDEIKLNIAHAQYQLDDTASAKSNYSKLSASNDKKLKSIAYQQLGVINKKAGKLDVALQQLKSAIKADPTNQEARYNYEVVKKLLEEQKKQEQQNQDQENQDQQENQENQDQENQDQENQENQDQENQEQEGEQNKNEQDKEGQQQEQEKEQKEEGGEEKTDEEKEGKEGEEQKEKEKTQDELTKEKLEQMNITEEKAKMILEAMKNNEIQYLQQQKRKAKERPPSDKPDW